MLYCKKSGHPKEERASFPEKNTSFSHAQFSNTISE